MDIFFTALDPAIKVVVPAVHVYAELHFLEERRLPLVVEVDVVETQDRGGEGGGLGEPEVDLVCKYAL